MAAAASYATHVRSYPSYSPYHHHAKAPSHLRTSCAILLAGHGAPGGAVGHPRASLPPWRLPSIIRGLLWFFSKFIACPFYLRKKSMLLFLQEKIRYFSIGKYRRRKLTIRFLDVVAANKIKLLLLAGPIVHAGRCRNEGYISTSHFTTCMQNLTHIYHNSR